MTGLREVKKQLRPGMAYRRSDLQQWSNAVDRHIRQLQNDGTLRKLSMGLYYRLKQTVFGEVPVDDKTLVQAFLKDHRFLLTSPNAYNSLGVGTTQLYNKTVVYNHKRHGKFKLGERTFDFRKKAFFPLKPFPEFLLVDLVNNIKELAEDEELVLSHVKEKAHSMDKIKLARAIREYGGARAQKIFETSSVNNAKVTA